MNPENLPENLGPESQGSDVELLQKLLNELVLNLPWTTPLKLDGVYGPKTQAAVVTLQFLGEVSVTGIFNLKTKNALLARHEKAQTLIPK